MVKTLGVHEVTYHGWRKEYGGLQVSQAKRLKRLERENARRVARTPTSLSTS